MNFDEKGEVSGHANLHILDGEIGEAKDNNRLVSDKEGLREEDKVNGIPEDVRNGHLGAVRPSAVLQIPQQQPQATATVCWERFLHVRSIKVLLVENDDSTRHVVTALLRNCSYEVIEAANGVQAWKILEDLNNHIDIVLTELVMPYLSGIGLLCKILSHKNRSNIPVIMMSSHDSMGLVFKCLSKGAVDFLVKPLRKNELKNLWQHVWRRCHSSSGSGSESGTQTQKSVRSKSVVKCDNNTGSNDEHENGSMGLNVCDASSDGSGTQSSWTNQAVEVDSPRPLSPWDRVDSTCAQVIHSNAEEPVTKLAVAPAGKDSQKQDEQLGDAVMGKNLEIGVPDNLDSQFEHKVEVPITNMGTKQDDWPAMGSSKRNIEIDKGKLDCNCECPRSKAKHEACVSSCFAKSSNLQDNSDSKAPKTLCQTSDVGEGAIHSTEELMSLEHGSKRQRGVKNDGTSWDDRNVLRRSESSAFSRYNPALNVDKPSSCHMGSNSLHGNSQDATKKGSVCDCRSNLNDGVPNQYSNIGSNNIDMGSTTDNNAFNKPGAPKNNSAASSSGKHSTFRACSTQQVFPHHCEQKFPLRGLSNVYCGVVEGNALNYSVNGSFSGSNHGSNGQNGSSTAVNAGGANMESENNAKQSGSGDASGSGSGNRVDRSKISRREAALTKFRQKRKERCFRKKVRYQSRKKLAEQRPRVRGQFVRKTANDQGTSKPEDDL